MLSKIWELLIDYVKEKRIWGVVLPALILGAAFLGAQLLTLQYLKWQPF